MRHYKKYAALMKKSSDADTRETLFFDLKMIQEIVENQLSLESIKAMDAITIIATIKTIHFIMQEIISPKFLELLGDEVPEKEESAFDEYDREYGYEDEEQENQNIWETCEENIDRIIKIAIRLFNDSYTQCLDTEIISLLDFIKFEIRTINEK